MIIKGWNDFYEGWLARIFSQPRFVEKDESWKCGWDTADESPSLVNSELVLIFKKEIDNSHIIVLNK